MMLAERWSIARFGHTGNLPEIVGELSAFDALTFSTPNNIRVLDMCLKVGGDPNWQVPTSLAQFLPAITKAADFERKITPIEYVYITVDQNPVAPGKTQRRTGWHSDGYIVDASGYQIDILPQNAKHFPKDEYVERTYVIYDTLPTLFAAGPFPITCDPDDCDAVLGLFDDLAASKPIVTYPPYTLLALDPYCVHSVQVNPWDEHIWRTFVKIQFSTKRYNRAENSRNPSIDYSDWNWVSRDPLTRSHRYA